MAPPFAFRSFKYLDLSRDSGIILMKNFRGSQMLKISESIEIPLSGIEIKAVRSQGSGGQHVNKVSTAIHLLFNIEASSLSSFLKERLLSLRDHRITVEGIITIKSQESRSQSANTEEAMNRLKQLVQSVRVVPKKRCPTKPSRRSQEKRLKLKIQRGCTKSLRRRPSRSE